MKKVLSALLVVVMIGALLAACGGTGSGATASTPAASTPAASTPAAGTPAPSEAPAATGGFKVASHNAVVEGNPYRTVYEDQMAEAANAAKAAGLISEYNSFVANNDPALETQQLEQSINDGYDIILVNPIAASGLDAVIDKATDAGITYVNADCIYDSDKILNVVVDQDAYAKLNSDFVIKTLGAGSKVVQFKGIEGNSATEIRSKRWTEDLAAADIEIVKAVAHNWSDPEAKQLMSEILASGLEFDGIINEESAQGIMDAIEEAGAPYPGCITSSEEIAWIRRIAKINENELVCPFIVTENPPGIGATALAVAINVRLGNELDESKMHSPTEIYYAPQWIMTYDNMAEKLDEVKDMPDSMSISSYLSVDQAKAAYFK
ncbi:substrate-binding domain-containing protein [Anaerotruncus colihominis]|uniref:substrate-binding domain-containing protein n=1 Tax=Anaerotruncus colihominis TaxID=169435 RepID=UPI0035161A4C